MIKPFLLTIALFSSSLFADTYVNGYVKRNGTYVQGHYRSSQNDTKLDNYSTQGNVNPYTGQSGTVNPYRVKTGGSIYGSGSSTYGED